MGGVFFCFSQISSKVRMQLGSRGEDLAIVSVVFNGAQRKKDDMQFLRSALSSHLVSQSTLTLHRANELQ